MGPRKSKNFDNDSEYWAHLVSIVESSDDAIISKTLHGTITSWNKGAESLFGYTAEEVIGKSILLLIPPGYDNEEPEIINKLKQGIKIDHYETVRRRKDGRLINVSLTVSPVKDFRGKVIGASKIARDITAIKDANENNRKLAAIIESSGDAIITKNLNSIITSWNKGAEEIFGYKADEIVGKSVLLLMPPDRHREEPEILARLQRGERIEHYETVRQRKDGKLIDISLTVSPIVDAEGKVTGASKIARDITEQKRTQESLARINYELKDLTANLEKRVEERTEQLRQLAVELIVAEETERKRLAQILHDHLQQLLVAAKMKIDLIQRKTSSIDKNAINELRKFIDDAFDSSRSLTAELRPPVLYESGLIPALRFLVRKFYDQYQFKIDLSVSSEAVEPATNFLKAMIYSMVQEIVFNAVKYAGIKECSVQIKRLPDTSIQIIVQDEGIGFHIEGIGKKGSEGFGLFGIRERIKALGGEFKIESSLGNGARFEINIPDIKEELLTEDEQINDFDPDIKNLKKRKNGGLSVLLVDDHKILRQSLANLLLEQSFIDEILEAEDGQDALDKVRYTNPDVIIMDLNIPRLNGIEATRIIHQNYPGIKIIGLSIQTEPETMQAMKDNGAVAYFHKGEDTDVLIEALKDFLKPTVHVN